MSDKTNISYCDHTWSPWRGCEPVSPGCAHCYASAISKRSGLGPYRKGMDRVLTKDWKKPVRWNGRAIGQERVLVSMCDPLDDNVPYDWFVRFLELIQDTPNLTWLVLTKRPGSRGKLDFSGFPNLWLGVSAEDQQRADERIPVLLSIPARVRFVSAEPLLARIGDLWLGCKTYAGIPSKVDWVIVGGESGPRHRPMEIEWLRSIVEQCKAAGVACFVKQDSHRQPGQQGRIPDDLWAIKQFPTPH